MPPGSQRTTFGQYSITKCAYYLAALKELIEGFCIGDPMKASQTLYKMASQLPTLPEVEQLSTNIIRILGGNPSKVGSMFLRA